MWGPCIEFSRGRGYLLQFAGEPAASHVLAPPRAAGRSGDLEERAAVLGRFGAQL
jgi:hypothetical protein